MSVEEEVRIYLDTHTHELERLRCILGMMDIWVRVWYVYMNRHRDTGAIDFQHLVMNMEQNTKHAARLTQIDRQVEKKT